MSEMEEEGREASEPGSAQPSFVRSALVFYGVMGCAALIWRMTVPGESILHPSAASAEDAWSAMSALGAGLFVGLAAVGVSELLTRATSLGEGLADLLGESLAGLRASDAVLLALASGLAEEMLFRGALQPSVGLVWASLIFGACHFLPRKELALWSLFAVVMGFAFGTLYEWTGHLLAPVAAHALVNGINLPRLARRYEEKQLASPPDDPDDPTHPPC
jgi:membrane protease YdiL (CAAX protease family)